MVHRAGVRNDLEVIRYRAGGSREVVPTILLDVEPLLVPLGSFEKDHVQLRVDDDDLEPSGFNDGCRIVAIEPLGALGLCVLVRIPAEDDETGEGDDEEGADPSAPPSLPRALYVTHL